ncbi:MAG TPA: BamA/TamA family outer membrane protein [Kofleriaceae bacterium]|nr:BamA/TamA family outer membrane protein [Kofleriaceae bacterium]
MQRVTVVAVVAIAAQARAQPPDTPAPAPPPDGAPAEPPPPDEEPAAPQDEELGPILVIERIDVLGNTATRDEVIRRVLPIAPGDAMRASDKRLTSAKFKVLALGFFRDVKIELKKGTARGQVVLVVTVAERGTMVLNRLWFGTNELSPYWLGADVTERNLLGWGIAFGGGFIYADHGDVDGARDQYAGEVRIAVPSLRGTRFGANASLTLVHGSETYRVLGSSGSPELDEQRAFPYRRFGARVGVTYDVTALTRLAVGLRTEEISTQLPVAPTLTLDDGRLAPIDLHLEPGKSYVTTGSFVYDRDTRPDPILSHSGGHLALGVELGAAFSDYQFATIFGRYEHYWPLKNEKHAIAIKLAGGVVVGDAPRFDRIHIADVNHMLTPRALGLVLSTASPLDILGTRADKPTYGDLGGSATVEYAMELWRGKGKKRVYGSDLFVGLGLWGLAETADLRARDTSLGDAMPIDIYADAGVRLDTDIGIFELTVANGLGRLR